MKILGIRADLSRGHSRHRAKGPLDLGRPTKIFYPFLKSEEKINSESWKKMFKFLTQTGLCPSLYQKTCKIYFLKYVKYVLVSHMCVICIYVIYLCTCMCVYIYVVVVVRLFVFC